MRKKVWKRLLTSIWLVICVTCITTWFGLHDRSLYLYEHPNASVIGMGVLGAVIIALWTLYRISKVNRDAPRISEVARRVTIVGQS